MRPGTIVVCLPCPTGNPYVKWEPVMDEKTPYMIREFIPKEQTYDNQDGVYFEEGVIGHYNGHEIGFPARYVREILPPEEISEEIKERIEEPMYV